LILFASVYLLLFNLFIYLLDHKIKKGPADEDRERAGRAVSS